MAWSLLPRRTRREIRRYVEALPRLKRLDWAAWRMLMRAQAALLRAQWEMRSRPTGELVSDDTVPTRDMAMDRLEDARRVALAVNRAATYGVFRPLCLARAMALRKLLAGEGIEGANVRVGVLLRNGAFIAHAWVEYAGQVVGDDPLMVARYAPLEVQVRELE